MKLGRDILAKAQASTTPRDEQVVRIGGKYIEEALKEANWYREQCIESNESNRACGIPSQPIPDEITVDELRKCTYLGRRVEVVDGDEDILEVV